MPNRSQKIKLIQIIADSDLSGGPKHVLGLLSNIDKSKFDCLLICTAGDLAVEAGKIEGVSVAISPMNSKFDLPAIFSIQAEIEKFRTAYNPFGPLIVHLHGTRAAWLGRLAVKRRIKTVYTEHRYDADYHLQNPLNEYLQKKVLAYLLNRMNAVIAVSSSVKDFLIKGHLAKKDKIVVIPNGIEVASSKGRVARKIKEGNHAPIIGTVGNLNIQKGHRYLIEAMPLILKKYPLATLEIIGEGPDRDDLEDLIETTGLERHVSLLGRRKDIYDYLEHWDAFVLPSVAETFGIVLLEAMQAGIPIVATRVGGVPDIIHDRREGLLVPSRNPNAIANAAIELLDHPVLAAKLKHAGKERVKDFEWKKIIKKIEELYCDLIKEKTA